VEELEDREISGWTQLVAPGPRFGPGKEPLGLAAVEIPRQALLQLWHPGRSRDVVGNSVMFLEKPVEAPHCRQSAGGTPLGEAFALQLAEKSPQPQSIHRLPLPA